jgi:serine/threonine-protein kinase
MPLTAGAHLGPYEILAAIGAGGMGEVYRARDPKLGRDIAIKVLPDSVANDPERLARFEREAKVLAALNHPNIAHIHGFEDSSAVPALVMELVEGPTLADRIAHGPIPIDETLAIARQIAEALEAAHEQGIIHRDLKPANIKVRPDSTVKVLDFGLAKAPTSGVAAVPSNVAGSPTITTPAMITGPGAILGSAAYMSPEQTKGRPVDKRTDIWAFGCVLFEMLAGRRAFPGVDVTDATVAILSKDPDWSALPPAVPAAIRRLLKRCLEKDPKRRLDSAAAVRLEIDEILIASPVGTNPALDLLSVNRWTLLLPWGVAAALAMVLVVSLVQTTRIGRTSTSSGRTPIRLHLSEQVPASPSDAGQSIAIAPDGTRVVFLADTTGTPQLHLRDLRSIENTPIAGTNRAVSPFFSPDGRRIGFFSRGKLQVLALAGGTPVVLADASSPRGAEWALDDSIIYSPDASGGLWQVPAAGGTPRPLAQPDSAKGERTYRWPELLPGGDAVMFTVGMSDILSFDDARLVVRSLRTGEQHEVVRGGSFGTYAATGQLLYARAGALWAVPFDVKQMEVTGTPTPVLDGFVTYPLTGAAQYALSLNGTLVYVSGKAESPQRALLWVSRTGQTSPLAVPPAEYFRVSTSRDGRRAAFEIDGANASIWILDPDRALMTRLTMEWSNSHPTWTPDATRVVFNSARSGISSLFWQRVDSQGGQEPVFLPDRSMALPIGINSWLPDGRTVIFDALSARTGRDLWVVRLDGERVPEPLLQTSFNEFAPDVSPDGRWLAFVSDETGRQEVYLQPYPGPGGRRRVSVDGGTTPMWAHNGRELFFRSGDAMMSLNVNPSRGSSPEEPRSLFRINSPYRYGIGPDGRFLMIEDLPSVPARPVTVVLNWFEELEARVPTK